MCWHFYSSEGKYDTVCLFTEIYLPYKRKRNTSSGGSGAGTGVLLQSEYYQI